MVLDSNHLITSLLIRRHRYPPKITVVELKGFDLHQLTDTFHIVKRKLE